jgi:hypothetical protein
MARLRTPRKAPRGRIGAAPLSHPRAKRRTRRREEERSRFVPFASSSSHRPPRSDDAIGGSGGPNSVCGHHCLRLLIGRPHLRGQRACCKGVVRRRVVGFGRAQSSSLLTATTATKARDNKSEDGAWDDPRRCWIRCHVGLRTIKVTEKAEDDAIPPSTAATGEE